MTADLKQRVYTCRHVVDEGAAILQAHRDDDGDLQLLCGADRHDEGDARAMALGDMIIEHPSVVDIIELDPGQLALRPSSNEPWKVSG